AGAEDDYITQVRVRRVQGRLGAARGKMGDALAQLTDALALADQGEYYELRTSSRLVFAQLLIDAGHIEEALARAQEVLELARARGDVVFEGRARNLMNKTSVSTHALG